ncbi:MAG: response regulator [Elusimicrobia bacterium]|nr:response regulator [Elusimicrobiota bacterium]
MSAPAPCVLVVDDNAVNRALVDAVLRSDGWEVVQAESGALGVEAALRERPAVVVLDYHMPGLDGGDVVRRLSERLGDRAPATLLVTALSEDEARARAGDCGASAWLSKPFAPRALREKVRELASRGLDAGERAA